MNKLRKDLECLWCWNRLYQQNQDEKAIKEIAIEIEKQHELIAQYKKEHGIYNFNNSHTGRENTTARKMERN